MIVCRPLVGVHRYSLLFEVMQAVSTHCAVGEEETQDKGNYEHSRSGNRGECARERIVRNDRKRKKASQKNGSGVLDSLFFLTCDTTHDTRESKKEKQGSAKRRHSGSIAIQERKRRRERLAKMRNRALLYRMICGRRGGGEK